ncbi:MAG: protein kinase [Planctomycetes bacterium]|nr:protein kinase [Planctomycetota bacterium]
MCAESMKNEESIYHEAVSKPPEERKAYLETACDGDTELLARIEALLKAREVKDSFLEATEIDRYATLDTSPSTEGPGSIIGRYKLLEKIGEGGFGVVWAAAQKKPVKRRVALKIIKLGMDTRQVIARFEAERQALAMMDHPNIAKVLDAGATDTGRPYFVMELVRGIPIIKYCDQAKLSIRDRLDLFIKVCNAIQHAHQKGIIHRDIKPSNILITLHDGIPVPRVIDFGIAKATQQELTEITIYTQHNQFIGTPVYMSPEQAEMSGLDIDTRSDIYSLGVLLYELLTGRTPFDEKELMQSGIDEMRKIIREKEPQRPSTKFATLQIEEQSTTATHHSTDSPRLISLIRGDLDWIVMKCLEKDRTRRYDTANGLALDIVRHLSNEPVVARPPTVVYQLQKAWRRNKVVYTAVVAVVIALLLGTGVSAWQAWIANSARMQSDADREIAVQEERRAKESERNAEKNLYDSLVREARAVRIARGTGYRQEVFKALSQAHDLDVPGKDVTDLRSEAVACIGDYVGFQPTVVLELPEAPNAPNILLAALHPTDAIAAFALSDGTVILRDVHSSQDIARFECEHPPTGLCFAHTGNTLLSLHEPQGGSPDERSTDAVAHLFAHTQDGTWVQRKTVEVPHAKTCFATTIGFKIAVVDTVSGSAHLTEPLTGSIAYEFDFPVDANRPPVIYLSPDGRLLATATFESANSDTSVLDIWDITLDRHLERLEPGLAAGTYLKFSPDGRYLVFLSASGGVVYSTETWGPVGHLTERFYGKAQAIFLPHRTVLIFSLESRFFLWDFEKKEYIATFEQALGGGQRLSISADGKSLMTFYPKQAWLYTLDATQERLTLPGHTGGVPGIAFSPDGSRLASVGKDRRLRVWNSATGHLEWERGLERLGQGVAYSSDGRWLVTTDYERERVCIWSTDTTEQVSKLGDESEKQTWKAELTDDNQHLATATTDKISGQGAITIWSCTIDESDTPETEFKAERLKSFPGRIIDCAWAPNNRHLAFIRSKGDNRYRERELYLFDLKDLAGTKKPRLLANNLAGAAAQIVNFTPDSRQILVVDANRFIVTYDVQSGQKLTSFPTLKTDDTATWNVVALMHKLSPDGTKLAMGSRSALGVDLWDCENQHLLYSIPEQEGFVYYFAWSQDGRRLAVSRSNGDIDIWNIAEIERVLADLRLWPPVNNSNSE